MAAGPIFNAIADLTRLNQRATLERIVAASGSTMATVITALKANTALLNLSADNIRLKLSYTNTTDLETAITAAATPWGGQ